MNGKSGRDASIRDEERYIGSLWQGMEQQSIDVGVGENSFQDSLVIRWVFCFLLRCAKFWFSHSVGQRTT